MFFKNYSQKELKKIKKTIDNINELNKKYINLNLDELKEKSIELKNKVINEKIELNEILEEAFAICKQVSFLILGLNYYDVQLMGGIILHQGRIAEMQTGEGKTLVATLPIYLNALTGRGVHVVTVNDYLAKRDMETMKPFYEALGLTVNVIVHESSKQARKQAYNSDITYITNTELGFDYLRDNMVQKKEDRIMRELNYCLIDEVDSVLIDEARTPLIISGQGEDNNHLYQIVDVFIKNLNNIDYKIDEEIGTVYLTETGVSKAEFSFDIENLSDLKNSILFHYINQSLKANFYFKKDKHYMVKKGEIIIIDEFTGRLSTGRRYSDGLHQAIESKEGVEVQCESKTLASITYQNFFKSYKKLSGMTGTAITEQNEFNETYNLDVIEIPTNKPVIRVDNVDKIYMTYNLKLKGIIKDIKECNRKGQPVLIGTSSIEKSEELSQKLSEFKIPHNVLNAKNHEQEAKIISEAGKLRAVTIATNMAGRGTDIKLGKGVINVGGLKVIGSERHNNRRIDNQLRGRAGRQGDPGESIFYLSFEDEIMRIYGQNKIKEKLNKIGNKDNDEYKNVIENKIFANAINKAQRKIEGIHFESRKDTSKYDNFNNKQRKLIYKERNQVLEDENLIKQINFMVSEVVKYIIKKYCSDECIKENNLNNLINYLNNEFLLKDNYLNINNLKIKNEIELKRKIEEKFISIIKDKEINIGKEVFNKILRTIILTILDEKWRSHIENLKELKRSLNYYSMKQVDPFQTYMIKGANLFNELNTEIQIETIKYILKLIVGTKN